jgi:hypothetical protein
VVILAYTMAANPPNPEQFIEDNKVTVAVIEAAIVIGVAVLVFGIGAAIGKDPAARRRDEDDWGDDRRDDRQRPRNQWE